MKDLLTDERLFYRRPGPGVARHVGIMLSALLLTAGTILLIPLSDALTAKPVERLEFQTVSTTSWRPPPPPPPRELPKPPPPNQTARPIEAKAKPKLSPRPVEPPRPTTRLPLRIDFETPKFAADFALNFVIDPTATAVPEATEPTAGEPGPPATAPEKDTYESSELDQNPVPISRPQPVFPYYARRRGIEGYVDVRFTVNAQGAVEAPETLAAQPAGVFESEALRAIRRWRFKPGIRDRKAVAARMQIRIRFTLDP